MFSNIFTKLVSLFKIKFMEAITIEIINPKAKQLIKNLVDLKLISISKTAKRSNNFESLLTKLRVNFNSAPSMDEIAKEVEIVRANRYARKAL